MGSLETLPPVTVWSLLQEGCTQNKKNNNNWAYLGQEIKEQQFYLEEQILHKSSNMPFSRGTARGRWFILIQVCPIVFNYVAKCVSYASQLK